MVIERVCRLHTDSTQIQVSVAAAALAVSLQEVAKIGTFLIVALNLPIEGIRVMQVM